MIHPVILSGGVGSRLWPLSRSQYPKQLLALTGDRSLIQDTALRVQGAQFGNAVIACNVEHRFLIAEQMRNAHVTPDVILLEPVGRNTAPAAAVAAIVLAAMDPESVMLLMPADHLIADQEAFLKAVGLAHSAAKEGLLVTFGIKPHVPETGYGYIRRGQPLYENAPIFAAAGFVEKPDAATAVKYVAGGEYYWNSGMFMCRVSTFLAELEKWEPDLLAHCRASVEGGKRDLDFFCLEVQAFEASKAISIDYAIMERTTRAALVPVEMGWSDIGSWEALWNASAKDAGGNATMGDVLAQDARNSYLRSEGPLIAAIGVEDLVVIATSDAVLVSRKNESQDVKKIVERLESTGRQMHATSRKVYHSGGSYEELGVGKDFKVRHITLNPGGKLSLQNTKNVGRWVVASGSAQITCDGEIFTLRADESTFIPQGIKRILENVETAPLHIIEVQSGANLAEDDITRFEDS